MTRRHWVLVFAAALWGGLACSDAGGDGGAPDGGAPDGGADGMAAHDVVADTGPGGDAAGDAVTATDVGEGGDGGPVDDAGHGPDTGPVTDTGPLAECDKPVNATHRQALRDAQPVLEGRSKGTLRETVTFASLAGDPGVTCEVELDFRDANGNGGLEPYENWTLPPAERAADLVTRLSEAQKIGLMAHPALSDAPTSASAAVSAELEGWIDDGVRFGQATATTGQLGPRATWANNVQERCEASEHGVPFVISMAPAHSDGSGRKKAAGFSKWPHELGLGATGAPSIVETFAQVVSQEYRAVGVRMALSPSADLATEPRWWGTQFTFGEDSGAVADRVEACVEGLQGETLGAGGVAAVVGHFPGAGPAKDGWDACLAKGRYLAYPGDNVDAHLAPFARAIDAGAAAVLLAYGVPETGAWTGLGGVLDGATIEQVGASFNEAVVGAALRGHYGFDGLVIAPPGVLEDAGLEPLGAPWGVEALSRAERVARAVVAGVDQFAGLADPTPIADAKAGGLVTADQLDAAAKRALSVIFALGLFEDPYVDVAQAPALVNTDTAYRAGLNAMNRSMVLLVNEDKPSNWLNGDGDGSQVGDKGNAGNGTGKVLPAPPGEPYVAAGCSYFILGNFDLDYVRSVSTGYGELTNDAASIDGVAVDTAEERIPLTDYVFIRVDAPYTADADSGGLELSAESLEYAGNDNADVLDDVAFARAAIDAHAGAKTQIIVGVDAGRASVVDEILAYDVSGLYVEWSVTDKVFLDVAFGIVDGSGTLPVGLPASDAAAAGQQEDVAGDGQHATFVEGFGLPTDAF